MNLKPIRQPNVKDRMLIWLAIAGILYFLVSAVHCQQLEIHKKEKAALWIQIKYAEHSHGRKMSFGQALTLVDYVSMDCFIFDLDFDRVFSQFSWESCWVNKVRFKKLKVSRWSFGIAGLTIGTAREEAKRLRQPASFCAHELIANEELNILLGCGYMKHLLDRYHWDRVKAETAYNAGPRGMKLGYGVGYSAHISQTEKEWKAFEQSRQKAE